jgi:hypothetical protein
MESNTFIVENIDFNLKQLVEEIKNSLVEIAFTNNNGFILNIDSNIPDHLMVYPIKLSHNFVTLINNFL